MLINKLKQKWNLDMTADELDAQNEEIFHVAARGSNASGKAGSGKAFVVLAGSIVAQSALDSLQGGYAKLRQNLLESEVIKNCTFMVDYVFDSPSAASAIVLGRASNGLREWSTLDGRDYAHVIGH